MLFYSRKVNYYRHYYNLKQIIWQRKSRVYAGLTDFLIDATVKLPGVNSNNCRKDSGCNGFCCVDRVFEMTYTEFSDCSVETYEACRRGRIWGSLPLFVLWNARACLKNHFRNLQAPLCGIFYPHSPLRRPYSDKISHELGLAVHEKPFSDTLYSGHAGSGTGRKRLGDKKWN